MAKFAIKIIEAVKGKQVFQQLVVLRNNDDDRKIQSIIDSNEGSKKEIKIAGQLDLYENNLEEKDIKSFRSILAIMDQVANLKSVPQTKFKDITPKSEDVKEYEFKSSDLRVYAIKMPNGKMILLGGYKNSQPRDIDKFRSLKRQYLETNKNKK